MLPWTLLDTAQVPDGAEPLRLYRRAEEFSIRVGRHELMNSRNYASEAALGELGCARIQARAGARVLIGGLGMGYSLRAALAALGPDAEIIVAELVPAIVTWNREVFGHLAGHPLRDRRVSVRELDVGRVIAEQRRAYDAILLDVDNGPDGLTRRSNAGLYDRHGLAATRSALRERGVLGVWSSGPDRAFVRRLQQTDFVVEERSVRGRGPRQGARYTIWLATPSGSVPPAPVRSDRK